MAIHPSDGVATSVRQSTVGMMAHPGGFRGGLNFLRDSSAACVKKVWDHSGSVPVAVGTD
jgi:hypothetical protein